MRIIAGEKKGFRLKAPPGRATRPTLDRVRESLFMRIMAELPGVSVLDLFAGAGTLGLEALSRGAAKAVFVDSSRPAIATLRDNLYKLGWPSRGKLVQREALRWLRSPSPEHAPWDVVFIDPPYGQHLAAQALERLAERAGELLNPDALIVVQADRRDPLEAACGPLSAESEHPYGDTRIVLFRYGAAGGEVPPPSAPAPGGAIS